MSHLPEWKVDVAGRLGKRLLNDFMKYCGKVHNYEKEPIVVQNTGDLIAYFLERYEQSRQWVAGKRAFCKNRTAEEILLATTLQYQTSILTNLGLLQSFKTGDFSCMYRGLMLCVRYCYASQIYLELLHGRGYSPGSGIDHGAYEELVLGCFALMRPDLAKRFFPKELGLITRSHRTTNHVSSLIAGLLHDHREWKEKSVRNARAYLGGKRQVAERAAISCLLHIHEDDADGVSEDLQILLDNFRKATWLMGPTGGPVNTVSLYGLYLMGKYYMSGDAFLRVRRPSGPGWWMNM